MEKELFLNCSSLKTVIVSELVEEIKYNALNGCSSLAEITVVDNNKYLCIENMGLYNKSKTIFYRLFLAKADVYKILDGVEKNEKNAFKYCSVKNVIIPKTVIDIESEAFSECKLLESIDLPGSVQSISSRAFYSCSSLQTISRHDNVKFIGDGAFSNCTSLNS